MAPLFILSAIGIGAFILYISRQLRMRPYWSKACTGADWKRRFPDAPKNEIRDFLDVFADAFAFSRKKRLKFSPDDKIMDVYRSIYPLKGMDSMELEAFAKNLEKKYGIDLYKIGRPDTTLGEIFEITRK